MTEPSFTNTAHIDDGGGYSSFAHDIAIGSDGIIFLANHSDGMRAYSYDGTTFTNTAHIDDGGLFGNAHDVAVGSNGTVYLANGYDGLRAYSYNGTSFTNTAHIDDGGTFLGVAVGADGTIFIANGTGLRAYLYNGTDFFNTAHIASGGVATDVATDVAVGSNGTVYLANGEDGLRAYSYDGISFSFTNTAHINDGSYYLFDPYGTPSWKFRSDARAVAVGADGTVFLANGREGMFAYTYSSTLVIETDIPTSPNDYILAQNYPNPFNPITIISYSVPKQSMVSLKVFNVLGKLVKTLINEQKQQGNYKIQFDASSLPSGVYLYQLQSGNFVETKKLILLR